MTKKITISVPDDLHEKMMEWKDSFNFSKVFQAAISDAINKKEGFQKRIKEGSDIEAITKRLRQEKKDSEDNYFEKGKEEGLMWAKAAHYDDLQKALNWQPSHDLDPRYQNYDEFDGYFHVVIIEDPLMDIEEGFANNHLAKFTDGWIEGVHEFWKEIEDKI